MVASSSIHLPLGVGISLTIVKLNDENYLLWSRAVKKYLFAQGKVNYLADAQPVTYAKDYQNWIQDTMVTTWLTNSMEPSIAATTMWLDTTKELWGTLQDRFGLSKNVSNL